MKCQMSVQMDGRWRVKDSEKPSFTRLNPKQLQRPVTGRPMKMTDRIYSPVCFLFCYEASSFVEVEL